MIKVLIIGESCTDKFIYGTVERLSPEAPIPIFKPVRSVENRGMSGNVAENLKALEDSILITEWTQEELLTKTRFVEDKSNYLLLRVDEGENTACKPLEHLAEKVLTDFDIVIVSDYDKGFLSLKTIKKIGKLSKLSILDSKKILTNEVVSSFTFVKLNEEESKKNSHLDPTDNIITTLGKRGAAIGHMLFESVLKVQTSDVSGAGDTFVAAFILQFYKTRDVANSILFANSKASTVVSKRGVSIP